MAVTDEQLEKWLGKKWELAKDKLVDQENWSDAEWRAQYLCQQARLSLAHVHDEPSDKEGKRTIRFAQRKL